jgi:hypothetical protein
MRSPLLVFITIVLFSGAFAQVKPLSQPEYVKLLYAAENDPAARAELVQTVRERGISFTLTDGIRSLTRTKGKNNEELKRVIEEADRRRMDPTAFQRPDAVEATDVLKNARERTLAAVEEMPDFVVKQLIQRSAAYAGTGTFRNLDRLIVGVSYRSSGEEEYRVLSVNGAPQSDSGSKRSYEEVGGTSSTGEFVSMLATIFKPESDTEFEVLDTDVLRGRKAITFSFNVERDKARQGITCTGYTQQSATTGLKGKVWIDRENFRVLRIESEATEIPPSFPCPSAKRNIDYDWTTISEERYLLPTMSDVRLTIRNKDRVFESRNVIRFRDYQKFGTEVTIVEEDEAPIEDEKP